MYNRRKFNEFEIDIDGLLSQNGLLTEYLCYQDLKDRKLFLNCDVSQSNVGDLIRHIMQYNREDEDAGLIPDERRPIFLYVSTRGGEVDAGYALIDVIRTSKTPVYTVNQGYAYSMGFLISIAGHIRFAMPNAKYLLHDGSSAVFDSSFKAQDRMDFYRRQEDRTREYVLENTSISAEEYDSRTRIEWYFFADEAKQKGIVDYIVGEDCDITAVI